MRVGHQGIDLPVRGLDLIIRDALPRTRLTFSYSSVGSFDGKEH
jgi:hypothetical protein